MHLIEIMKAIKEMIEDQAKSMKSLNILLTEIKLKRKKLVEVINE